MRWKDIVRDYLTFTRKDRIAVLVLLAIMVGLFFLPDLTAGSKSKKEISADTSWISAVKKLERREAETNLQRYDDNHTTYQFDRSANSNYNRKKGELFYFDPNTITAEDWQRLGLRDKTITTIQNYQAKGGRFRKPGDLQKIYGLFPDEYERIAPYIRIASTAEINYTEDLSDKTTTTIQPAAKTYTSRYTITDINTADTTTLIALPGIGSKLAARIINFRDKLGGFYSISQVGETFGLPDSTFQKIKQYLKLENAAVQKININTASVDELKAHPYIKYSIANPIIAYRKEHGPFNKIEDIKKVMAVTEEVYNKISPYLITQ